jgi:DNA-binding MarR family transcriptional regulator
MRSSGPREPEQSIDDFVQLHSLVFHQLSLGGLASWMDLDISLPQLKVLMLLYSHDRSSVSGVAEALHSSLPNVTGLADRLEQQGFIERVSDPTDKRVVLLELSEKGRAILSNIFALRTDRIRQMYERLGSEERLVVLDALGVLLRALDQADAGHRLPPKEY